MKKFAFCLLPLLLLLFVGTASAVDFTPMAYQYFRMGHVSLVDADDFLVLHGDTLAKEEVSVVMVEMNLQQYYKGSWYDVYSYSMSKYHTSYVSATITVKPSKGTFRIRGVHSILNNGVYETATSYTGPVDFDP